MSFRAVELAQVPQSIVSKELVPFCILPPVGRIFRKANVKVVHNQIRFISSWCGLVDGLSCGRCPGLVGAVFFC